MNERRKRYTRILSIAGSDSGGGAGIQADLKTFTVLGCYGMTALTAITEQNTMGVMDCFGLPPQWVSKQIRAVMDDIGADAIKTGMLYSAENVQVVAQTLAGYKNVPCVADPVMVSTSGSVLIDNAGICATRSLLLPAATLLTPNLREAEILLGHPIGNTHDARAAAAADLCRLGPQYVLLKGGHSTDASCDDVLLHVDSHTSRETASWYPGERVSTRNDHGTGCTLSAAIASYLGKLETLPDAVRLAKNFVQGAIAAGADYCVGRGRGPLHHSFRI